MRETPEEEPSVSSPGAPEPHASASPAAARVSPGAVKQESRGASENPSDGTELVEENEPPNRTRSHANSKKGTLKMSIIHHFVPLIQRAFGQYPSSENTLNLKQTGNGVELRSIQRTAVRCHEPITLRSLTKTVFSAPAGRSTRRTRPPVATVSQPFSSTRGSRPMNKPLEVLHSTINTLKGYSLFAEPVTDRLAEGYSKVVREPQDLKTIRANIRNGTISTTDEYERAIYLMFANAMMYNLPGSAAANDAKEVRCILPNVALGSTHGERN
jgi:hypothetical protein